MNTYGCPAGVKVRDAEPVGKELPGVCAVPGRESRQHRPAAQTAIRMTFRFEFEFIIIDRLLSPVERPGMAALHGYPDSGGTRSIYVFLSKAPKARPFSYWKINSPSCEHLPRRRGKLLPMSTWTAPPGSTPTGSSSGGCSRMPHSANSTWYYSGH